jgi:hypothetical protein
MNDLQQEIEATIRRRIGDGYTLYSDEIRARGWDPFNGIMKNATPRDDISVDERFSRLAKEIKLYHDSIEFLAREAFQDELSYEDHPIRLIEPSLTKIIERSVEPIELFRAHLDAMSIILSKRSGKPVLLFGFEGFWGDSALKTCFRSPQRRKITLAVKESLNKSTITTVNIVTCSQNAKKRIDELLN